jgi:hypothetical protein
VPTGTFSDCLQIPVLAPGRYTLELVGNYIAFPPAPTSTVAPAGATMTLTPPSGAPGTIVHVTGVYPGGPPPSTSPGSVSLCWGGCRTGLVVGMSIAWSAGGHFSGTFEVPTDPWIGPDGIVVPRSGPVSVGIECFSMEPSPLCFGVSDASATFQLVASGPQRCETVATCASLAVTPAETVEAGEIVQASGWMPTPTLPDSEGQFTLVWATQTATPSLTTRVGPAPGGLIDDFLLADVPLTVVPNPAWSTLVGPRPALIQANAIGNLQSDPTNDADLALCTGAEVQVSRTAGASWQDMPVTGAIGVSSASGCQGAWIDRDHPASAWVAGEVPTSPDNTASGYVGSYTTNRGASWQTVPVPPGVSATSFGGFRVSGDVVQALFTNFSVTPAPGLSVVQTADGGLTWHAASLACPATGPCVTWGPAAPGNCAAQGAGQSVLTSDDGGATWQDNINPAAWSSICSAAYLVSLRSGQVLLLSGGYRSPFGPMLSNDGGRTWTVVALPTLVSTDPIAAGPVSPSVLLLPNGTLLGFGYGGSPGAALAPGRSSWCSVAAAGLGDPGSVQRYEVIGSALWWTAEEGTRLEAKSAPLGGASC